jgi:two-component system phosphate regulon sensor histidine kinase PhoR
VAGYIQFRHYAMDEVDGNLHRQARIVSGVFRPLLEAASPDREKIASEGDRIGKDLEIRLTLILPDGTVLADSTVGASGVAGMENHADRPEVQSALSGNTGVSLRRSITVREEERYLAIPILSEGRIVGIARTSIPFTHVSRRLDRIRAITWGTGIAAFLLMLAGTAIRAKRVTGPLKDMTSAARELASGNLGKRIRVKTGDELETLAEALNTMASRLEQTISMLEAKRSRLTAVIESLSEGVVVVASDRTARILNGEAANILGSSVSAPDGRPVGESIRHPEVLAFIDGWMKGESPEPREAFIPSRTGDRIVRLAGVAVPSSNEQGTDLLLTLRDVTEEKRLARVKSDFVSNASHELKTPLTIIRGYLEAIEDALREGAPVDPSFLSIACSNALRMDRLIEDLLELSRAESGRSLAMEEIPISVFLNRIAALHRPAAELAGKALLVEGDDATLRADVPKLTLALSNLLDNAIKHGKEGGRITLAGRAVEGGSLLEVADDGPGISSEHLPRIFERFYRVDKGRSRDMGGTGLGLSIAKHIVESHRGTIRAESRIGMGTRFVIRIPS